MMVFQKRIKIKNPLKSRAGFLLVLGYGLKAVKERTPQTPSIIYQII